MKTYIKIYENILSLTYLLILCSHNLCDKDIYQIQNKRIKKLMEHAYNIPFYRKKFDEAGLIPSDIKTRQDLTKFPVLTKQELKDWLTPLIPDFETKYHVVSTSGSTGTPLKTLVSPRENAFLTANWLRIAIKNGVNPFCKKTLALKDPKIVAAGRDSIVQKFGLLRRLKLSFLDDGEILAAQLNQYKPDFVYMHKTKLLQIIEYAQKNHLELFNPKAYAVISEMISANDEKVFRKYMGNCIFTSYGCMETGACTFTPVGNLTKHIITNDTHVINVVNENNELAKNGKMLLTNLNFWKFPIINYDVGDNAEVYESEGVEYISVIHGRVNDWIVLKNGQRYDYHPFYYAFENQSDVLHFRVIQNDYDNIIIQLVGIQGLTEERRKEIEHSVLEQLTSVIDSAEMNYIFDWREKIEPDSNAKTRFIVSHVHKK